jgi:Spy/CpxP family protein refolding chaperone
MKKAVRWALIALVLSGSVCAASLKSAHSFEGSGFGLRGGFLKAIIQLNLSDAQKHEAALILMKYREEGLAKLHDLREATKVFREVSDAIGSDGNVVREAFKPVAAAGEEMAVFKAKVVTELKGLLTPEQLKIVQEFKGEMADRRSALVEVAVSRLDEWIEVHSQ